MQQGLDIVMGADRVHKDERPFRNIEGCAVTTRGFVLAIVEIEQVLVDHHLKMLPKLGINLIEDGTRAILQLVHRFERTDRLVAKGVHFRIPGADRGSDLASGHGPGTDRVDRAG